MNAMYARGVLLRPGLLCVCLLFACGGDVASRTDASPATRDAATDAPTCGTYTTPGDFSSFVPQYLTPAPATNACTKSAVYQAVASCLSVPSSSACADFKSQAAACYACIFGPGGPFVPADVGVLRNRGGCVELLDGATGTPSCGGRQQALDQCDFAACSAEKTVDECADVVTTALSDPSCAPKAEATVCAAYAKSVGGCGAAFQACFSTDAALAEVFCAKP